MTSAPIKSLQNLGERPQPGTALESLLEHLIDYAGLFPPASLEMLLAVENFGTYSRSKERWMQGRFIVSCERLPEFEAACAELSPLPAAGELSVLMGSEAEMARILAFQERKSGFLVKSVEVKVSKFEAIRRLAEAIPSEMEVYFELPVGAEESWFEAIAALGRAAKIRTGGETPMMIPASREVIGFFRSCAAANLAFKATAGLHHPLRSYRPLTSSRDGPSALMHGFLNIFLGAVFLRKGMKAEQVLSLLDEQEFAAFRFERDAIYWRGHEIGIGDVSDARKNFCISFGSCSFTEPCDDLRALGLL